MTRLRRGFTLIELMIVLAVAAVLAALAAPSFVEQLSRRRIEGSATDLSTDLQFARSQAVTEPTGSTVSVITQNSGTQYRIFKTSAAGTSTDIRTVFLPAGITVTNGITVTYDQLRGAAAAAQQLDLASTRTAGSVRLNVNTMGRVSICTPGGSLKGYTAC